MVAKVKASDTPDERLRKSPLWKKVVKAHAKLAAAQIARNASDWAAAWQELTALIEDTQPVEQPSRNLYKSRLVRELEGAFEPVMEL